MLVAAAACVAPAPVWAAGGAGAGTPDATPAAPRAGSELGRRAIAIADRTQAATELRAKGGVTAYSSPVDGTKWAVGYYRGHQRVLEVDVDLNGSRVDAVWSGAKADFPLARGYPGWFGNHVTAPRVWLPLCGVFLLLFVDRRRLRRLVHLDLLMILGFGASQWFFQRGDIGVSVPLAYVPLLYLLVRMASIARNRESRRDLLAPVIGPRALAVVLALVCAARIGLNVFDTNDRYYAGIGKISSTVVDVGYAGVAGANRIELGDELYTPTAHLDTYGPLAYLAYIPFERVWPFEGAWDSLPAAHAAAIAFDLMTIAGLIVLGLRLRPGRAGATLGLAMACAWAACPYSAYVLNANTNDGIVSASVVWALVAFRSSFVSGFAVGVGFAAKFVPAALLPALVRLRRGGGLRAAVLCLLGFATVVAVAVAAFAPPEGLGLMWSHTIARQSGSSSPFSVWGLWEWIAWLRGPLQVILIGAAVAASAAAFARERGVAEAAAVAAALVIGVEVTAFHWIYFYIVWFLPLVIVALFVAPRESPKPLRS
jgi:hypothetical protein